MNWKNKIYESLIGESRERTKQGNKIRQRKSEEDQKSAAAAKRPQTRWVGSSETGNMQKFVDGKWVNVPRLNLPKP